MTVSPRQEGPHGWADEMECAARAVIFGFLNPETAGAPRLVREQWLTSMTKTLAHIRGEAHAQ